MVYCLENGKLGRIISVIQILVRVIMETVEKIQQQISENPILLYMKGSPKLPNCGFSAQASQALMSCGEEFAYVDILQNPDIRSELPKYADWPTFPQLWVDGELVGGCDIIMEMVQQGELQAIVKESVAKRTK
ncbi:MAG: monothiol glutaredoxin, Grx4 family [Alteromonadaceae bacterium]|nr:glutaredoxin-like protein [Glaciecola sp. 4H-3-7+YE-5]MBN25602.1 monothiol glutaredoxin, Grx4 family [Alteromonadaceae bacterium]GAC05970.1 monothiol glutaredoxin [Paraglaciecola agarilytica NO2]GAC09594.1 monothiol glutaredoxin [Paraglaciecola chathamensis S18K6]